MVEARIKEYTESVAFHFAGPLYSVRVGETILLVTSDQGHASKLTRQINAAAASNQHNAMSILCEQIGFSEDFAASLYTFLKMSNVDDVASWHTGNDSVN